MNKPTRLQAMWHDFKSIVSILLLGLAIEIDNDIAMLVDLDELRERIIRDGTC